MNTKHTPDALPPDERRLLESVVTLISAHIKRANGVAIVTQKELPNMPRPVEPDYRPVTEYVLESGAYGAYLKSSDGHKIATFVWNGSTPEQREMNGLLVLAMVETFNAVQNDGR